MKKLILSSAFIVAGCFLAAAQNNVPATPATPAIGQPTEQAVAAEDPAKQAAKPACDPNAPKKACCSHDKKTSSAKSVKHKKHNRKMCKAECCVKKESN